MVTPSFLTSTSDRTAVRRRGFSLLEVIMATGILAASTVLLLQLLYVGERHGLRGEERMIAQMLCQTLMEEIVSGARPPRSRTATPVQGYPGWEAIIEIVPTELEGLAQVRVALTHVPPDLIAKPVPTQSSSEPTLREAPPPQFELVRWVRGREAASQAEDQSGTTPDRPAGAATPRALRQAPRGLGAGRANRVPTNPNRSNPNRSNQRLSDPNRADRQAANRRPVEPSRRAP